MPQKVAFQHKIVEVYNDIVYISNNSQCYSEER